MKDAIIILIFLLVMVFSFTLPSCTHNPIMGNMDDMPMDTTTMDTMDNEMRSCDPDTVYFQQEILPLIVTNCALSGCHNVQSASDGVVLDNYENIIRTGEVVPFDLEDSELYEVITEDDDDDVMPPNNRMSNDKIQLIEKWILQGALNNSCVPEETPCNINNMSYSRDIQTIIDSKCAGCHATATASGGVILDTYAGVKAEVDNGRLYGSITHEAGFSKMPQGLDKLDDCTISKIKSWIDEGAPNN